MLTKEISYQIAWTWVDYVMTDILCENSKLAQKEYKTLYDWVGRGIALFKKLKFGHIDN